jgi:hypothetical protein
VFSHTYGFAGFGRRHPHWQALGNTVQTDLAGLAYMWKDDRTQYSWIRAPRKNLRRRRSRARSRPTVFDLARAASTAAHAMSTPVDNPRLVFVQVNRGYATASQRLRDLPDVPTVQELIAAPFDAAAWFVIMARAGRSVSDGPIARQVWPLAGLAQVQEHRPWDVTSAGTPAPLTFIGLAGCCKMSRRGGWHVISVELKPRGDLRCADEMIVFVCSG